MSPENDERRRGSGAFPVDETTAMVTRDLYATLEPGAVIKVPREDAIPGWRYARVLHHGSLDPFTDDVPLAPPAVCSSEWEGAAGADPDAALRPNFQRGPRVPSPHHGAGPVPAPACSCGFRIVRDLDTLARHHRRTALGAAVHGVWALPEVVFIGVAGFGTVCQRQYNGRDPARTLRVSHLELVGPVIGAGRQRELLEALAKWYRIEALLAPGGVQAVSGLEALVPVGGGR